MIIFGGIYEVTKELNDLVLFDTKAHKWITFFEESNSPMSKGKGYDSFYGLAGKD